MKRLLELGILKDASIFGTAFFGIYIAKRMQKAPVYPALSRYPSLLRSPLAQAVNDISRLKQPCGELYQACEYFAELTNKGNAGSDGFLANRLAHDIEAQVRRLVARAQRSPDHETAIRAIDFERDDGVQQICGTCEDMLHNMLLG